MRVATHSSSMAEAPSIRRRELTVIQLVAYFVGKRSRYVQSPRKRATSFVRVILLARKVCRGSSTRSHNDFLWGHLKLKLANGVNLTRFALFFQIIQLLTVSLFRIFVDNYRNLRLIEIACNTRR